MLERIAADEIIRSATSGRTGVLLMLCGADTNSPVELFCKLSAGCVEGVTNLAREVLAASLAEDVGLPVPTPYLVEISPTLSDVVTDRGLASRLGKSSSVGFGSAKVGNQFSVWGSGNRVTEAMLSVALSALVFDAIIENPDRRVFNPNCLVSGERIFLIDHELGFTATAMVVGRRPPWQSGGLNWLDQPDGHIFCKQLKKRDLDLSPLSGIWSGVSDARLEEYRAAIPPEWNAALPAVEEAFDLADADHIKDKARRWRGHLSAVWEGRSENIELHFVLGRPENTSLMPAYVTAKQILEGARFTTEVVDESEVDDFVTTLEDEYRADQRHST